MGIEIFPFLITHLRYFRRFMKAVDNIFLIENKKQNILADYQNQYFCLSG